MPEKDMSPPVCDATDDKGWRMILAIAALLSMALALAVAWVDYLPTNDGPQHIFSAYLQNHMDDAGRGWNRYLDRGMLVTGSGFDHLLTFLDRFLSWRSAFRVALTGLALAWAWAVLALGASLGPRRRWLGLLGFATALQWQFYMGLFSCYLATALGFLVLAMAFRFGWHRRVSLALMAALLAVQTIVHVVPAVLTGLTLVGYAWLSSVRGARWRVLSRVALVGIPAVLIFAIALLLAGGSEYLNHYSTSLPFARQVALLGRTFVSGPSWRAWPVTLLALATVAVTAVRWRRTTDARKRTLALAGLALLVLALAMPLHIEGWEYFNVRFIPNAIIFLALLAPIDWLRQPALARAAAAILVVFSLASVAWGWQHNRFLRRQHADLLAGLETPLHRQGPRLPIVMEPPPGEPADDWERTVPYVTTNLHVGALYALEQGGVPAYLFAGAGAIHALTWRHPPEGLAMPPRPSRGHEWQLWEPSARADPALRSRVLAGMLSYGPDHEDVIFFGLPTDHVVLRERGFVSDFERGNVMIARFVGCPARVRIEPPEGGLPPTLLLTGWWPEHRPTYSTTLAARTSNEPIVVPIPQSPCGQIWIRVLFDMDRDGKSSPGDRTCRGADANAVVQHLVGPGTGTVVCTAGDARP
jgi:hypothetical protein